MNLKAMIKTTTKWHIFAIKEIENGASEKMGTKEDKAPPIYDLEKDVWMLVASVLFRGTIIIVVYTYTKLHIYILNCFFILQIIYFVKTETNISS